MQPDIQHDFALERRLRETAPELHRRFSDAVFSMQHILSNYQLLFPEFTDHTEMHSLHVIEFCNSLIGDQIYRLNQDEVYTLLMSCYFHDTGMGVSKKDYAEFSREIDFGDYFETHSRQDVPGIIRDFHNEYSGRFIRKYAEFFEIPSEQHLRAIVEISRGHRKTSLMDEQKYPLAMPVPGGNTICLPYLTALIRLADEIDVAASRNSSLLYDLESLTEDLQVVEHRMHRAISELVITPDAFIMLVDTKDAQLYERIRGLSVKMQETLDSCRQAVLGRTPYVITQKRVVIGGR